MCHQVSGIFLASSKNRPRALTRAQHEPREETGPTRSCFTGVVLQVSKHEIQGVWEVTDRCSCSYLNPFQIILCYSQPPCLAVKFHQGSLL